MASWNHRKSIKIAPWNGPNGIWGALVGLACNMMHTFRGTPPSTFFRDFGAARALAGPNWAPKVPQNPCKINRKIDAKFDAEQIMEKIGNLISALPRTAPQNVKFVPQRAEVPIYICLLAMHSGTSSYPFDKIPQKPPSLIG